LAAVPIRVWRIQRPSSRATSTLSRRTAFCIRSRTRCKGTPAIRSRSRSGRCSSSSTARRPTRASSSRRTKRLQWPHRRTKHLLRPRHTRPPLLPRLTRHPSRNQRHTASRSSSSRTALRFVRSRRRPISRSPCGRRLSRNQRRRTFPPQHRRTSQERATGVTWDMEREAMTTHLWRNRHPSRPSRSPSYRRFLHRLPSLSRQSRPSRQFRLPFHTQ